MNRWILLTVIGGIFLVLIAAGLIGTTYSQSKSQSQGGYPPPNIDINYRGDVSANNGLTLDGELDLGGVDVRETAFRNVSMRLYSESGVFLQGTCLGSLVHGTPIQLEYQTGTRPKYVIFASSEFWDREDDKPLAADYYEYREGQYVPTAALRQSSYPVDVTRRDPCQSDF